MGAMSQMYAGLTHRVTPERLSQIARTIPKVIILTGDDDNLVDPSNSIYLSNMMPGSEFVQWEITGHAIHLQHPQRFNDLVERVSKEGRQKLTGSL